MQIEGTLAYPTFPFWAKEYAQYASRLDGTGRTKDPSSIAKEQERPLEPLDNSITRVSRLISIREQSTQRAQPILDVHKALKPTSKVELVGLEEFCSLLPDDLVLSVETWRREDNEEKDSVQPLYYVPPVNWKNAHTKVQDLKNRLIDSRKGGEAAVIIAESSEVCIVTFLEPTVKALDKKVARLMRHV